MLRKVHDLCALKRTLTLSLALTLSLGACSRFESATEKSPQPLATLSLGTEDILVLGQSEFSSGPVVTGSVQPERRADLRAEVSAVVLRVAKENGVPVRRGEVLVTLDDPAIRDSLT